MQFVSKQMEYNRLFCMNYLDIPGAGTYTKVNVFQSAGKRRAIMKVNMRDVARHAGVSVATVSHVLNKTRHVTDATRERVMESIRVLGYVPDPMARSFKMGKRNMVGFIVPDIANLFWSIMIEEVENTLAAHGYHLIIANTKETEQREIDHLLLLSAGMVDGIIIGSTLTDAALIDTLIPDQFPMVFIDRAPDNCQHDSITISNYASIYEGICQLIRRGHTQIGCIPGLMRLSTTQERLQAYQDAMHAHGLEVPERFVQPGNSMSMSALRPMETLLRAGCTALAILNNVMAEDVMAYLEREKDQLGREVALLGYREWGRGVSCAASSALIDQPASQMGRLAAQQILRRIAEPAEKIKSVVLSSNLTIFDR